MTLSDQEYENCKELFYDKLETLYKEFVSELDLSKAMKTRYFILLRELTDYLNDYTHYLDIESIKPGDVVSRFYYQTQYDHDFPTPWKKYLLKFFLYLKECGHENQKVIQHLAKITGTKLP